MRLAALRQLSAQQVRERAALVPVPQADVNQPVVRLIRATTILFSVAISMLVVGTARSLSNPVSDFAFQLGLVVVGSAIVLWFVLRLTSLRTKTIWDSGGRSRIADFVDQQTAGVFTDHGLNYGQLRILFSICAFGAGLSLTLWPFALRAAALWDQWLQEAFIWNTVTQTIRLLVLDVLVVMAPLTFMTFGLRVAKSVTSHQEGEVSSMPLLMLLGGLLGVAASESIRNAANSPSAVLVAAAIPCFVIPILWIRKIDESAATATTPT